MCTFLICDVHKFIHLDSYLSGKVRDLGDEVSGPAAGCELYSNLPANL